MVYIHHMARLVRKQVYLTPEQDRRLKQAARKERRPAAEIIREALDRRLALETEIGPDDDPLWEAVGLAGGGPPDLSVQVDHYLYGAPRK
jgi:hypothetical protein